MSEKQKNILRVTSFALTMVMLALYSVGTLLAINPILEKKSEIGQVQLRTSGATVKINKFDILSNSISAGNDLKISIDGEISDGSIRYYALWAKNTQTGDIFYSTSMYSEGGVYAFPTEGTSTYIATPGTYEITGLTAAYNRNEADPFNYYYISVSECISTFECENSEIIKKNFNVTAAQTVEDSAPIYDYTMALNQNRPTLSIGDKLDILFRATDVNDEVFVNRKPVYQVLLSYTNENDGNILNSYMKSVNNSPYIIIPSTATPGTYNLNYAYLSFTDGTTAKYQNTATKTFSYNTSFVVKEKEFDTTKYMFSNELYDASIKTNIDKLANDAIITVDANKAPLINTEIFKAIQNTKRTLIIDYQDSQWVFSGQDIKNPKTIDVSTVVTNLSKNSEYYNDFIKNNVTSPSALLKFSDNGDLPGKVLIRISAYSIDEFLKQPDKAYVYYYKEDSDKLLKVAMEIQKIDNYFEFYINHNSKYIMSSKEIKTDAVSDDIGMLKLNNKVQVQSSSSTLITYVLATVCGVLAMGLLVVLLSKSKQTQKQQS